MDTFDKFVNQLLKEFNGEDRNDPDFYYYAVEIAKQFKLRGMVKTGQDVRSIAMNIITPKEDGRYYFNYKDVFEIEFIVEDVKKLPTAVLLKDKTGKVIKEFADTHEESSVKEIVEFITSEEQKQQDAGVTAPEQVGETPSEMPGAVQPQQQTPNTSQYLKGL